MAYAIRQMVANPAEILRSISANMTSKIATRMLILVPDSKITLPPNQCFTETTCFLMISSCVFTGAEAAFTVERARGQ
jgi:hypothetical protein